MAERMRRVSEELIDEEQVHLEVIKNVSIKFLR